MPIAKRLFDLALASTGCVVSAPLWLFIGFLIWLEDGRPLFLRQERIGRNGEVFRLLKFRSMWRHHEEVGLVEDRAHDPRVTRIGRLLRATALDELPQLLNIVKGDMSFVGPRALPLRVEDWERDRYRTIRDVEGYALRATVRPGLTGPAQIFAPKEIPRRMKFKYDLLYVRRGSFWLDVKLIGLSFWITFRGAWEKRDGKL